jgi:hypothetical protein
MKDSNTQKKQHLDVWKGVPILLPTGQNEAALTSGPWRMDDKWDHDQTV